MNEHAAAQTAGIRIFYIRNGVGMAFAGLTATKAH